MYQNCLKPGLHLIRKDRKHLFASMFFKLSRYGLVSIPFAIITSIDVSQEIFANGYIESFKILFEASSQACSATVTTIWRPGLSSFDVLEMFVSRVSSMYIYIMHYLNFFL